MTHPSIGRAAAALLAVCLAVPAARAAVDPSASAPNLYTSEDDGFRTGNAALSLHKLNYAVVGEDGLKLQYSFKFRVIDRVPFFFAYTNYMLWEVFEPSIPSKDNVFNPEIFYRFKEDKSWFFTVDAGYFHLSNGRPGTDSRALDRLAIRAHKAGLWWGQRPWTFSAQFFPVTLATGEYNQDYDHYVGWWDAELWLRNILGQERRGLDLQLARTAGRGGHPWQQGNNIVGLQYRLEAWPRVNPIFYAQWFSGYGEMMIDYVRYRNHVRAGISWFY